ncbi:MAG: OsmC family protein [marine benthic group bacterium]|nr:OsmC family protein [Candidatus Carthagonibacter metallireducens]
MVWVTASMTENTRVALTNGRHEWKSDEPLEKEGDDTGPTPYELLLGSLAACTLITLQLYARHKGIALGGVSARYEHEKQDDTDDLGKKKVVDVLTSHVEIAGEFTDAQRERLAQIVSRCPVHKTIENGSRVVDRVEFV